MACFLTLDFAGYGAHPPDSHRPASPSNLVMNHEEGSI